MNVIEKEDKLINDLHNHILSILGNEEITSDWFYDKFMELHSLKNNVNNDKNDLMKKTRHVNRTIFLAYLSLLLENKEIAFPYKLFENAYILAEQEITNNKFDKLINFEILNNISLDTFTPFETKFDFNTLDGQEFMRIFNGLTYENKIEYLEFRKEKKSNKIMSYV